jgi:hypothetical protein
LIFGADDLICKYKEKKINRPMEPTFPTNQNLFCLHRKILDAPSNIALD